MSKTQRSSARRDADAIGPVREILWPRDDPERQWTPDTLDRIAEVVMPSGRPVVNKPKRVSDAEVRALRDLREGDGGGSEVRPRAWGSHLRGLRASGARRAGAGAGGRRAAGASGGAAHAAAGRRAGEGEGASESLHRAPPRAEAEQRRLHDPGGARLMSRERGRVRGSCTSQRRRRSSR